MKEVIENSSLSGLGDELIQIIKRRKNIFEKITIVTPSYKTVGWFKAYWLKSNNDILMNIDFVSASDALLNMINVDKSYRIMKKSHITSIIVKILATNIMEFPDINKYYYSDKFGINANKVYDLSKELTKLFVEYEKDQIVISGWQKKLYDMMIEEGNKLGLSTLSYLFNTYGIKTNASNDLYLFGFSNLSKLEENIIDLYSEHSKVNRYYLLRNDNYKGTYNLITAPSKLREIEVIHSKICTLLQNKDNTYSDFLIYAPDINSYEGIINRVFNQDGKEYPNIPYVVNKREKVKTPVSLGLKKLLEIIYKGYYTRSDLVELINNEDVKKARNIKIEDIYTFSKAIIDMNAYRNSGDREDWTYIRNRLISSKIVNVNDIDENILCLIDNTYLPFSNISFDDDTILKFVKAIDDLSFWCNVKKDIEYVNSSNLYIIKEELDKWFSIKDKNGYETNTNYKNILNVFYLFEELKLSENIIKLDILILSLIDSSVITKFGNNECFTRGVTFTDFNPNVILQAKHVFFLDASSNKIPSSIVKSELDLRTNILDNIAIEEDAFNLIHQNATESFYISYVNLDLKTDESYYPSIFINNLKKSNREISFNVELDEKRNWNEIYTVNAFKNKKYYLGLFETKDNDITDKDTDESYNNEERLVFKLKQMAKFIEEPLSNKCNYLFGREDDLDEKISDEYEPFNINNLIQYGLLEDVSAELLKDKVCTSSDKVLDKDYLDNLKRRLNLEYKIPNITKEINNYVFDSTIDKSMKLVNYINEMLGNDYDFVNLSEKPIGNYKLICDVKASFKQTGNNISYVEIKKLIKKDSTYDSQYLNLYFLALMHVSTLNDDTYNIKLCRGLEKEFAITPKEAINILEDVCDLMSDYKNNIYLPLKSFDSNINKYADLIKDLYSDSKNPWEYYNDSNLFDYETQLGYTSEKFLEKYNEEKDLRIKLIKYFSQNDSEEKAEGDKDE